MTDIDLSRREILTQVGVAGVGAFGLGTGVGSAAGGADSRDPLNRHIVGVKPGKAGVARRAADGVYRQLDFGEIGQAVSGWYTEEALDGLRNNPNVRYIEAEGEIHAIAQTLPWGIDRVDADKVHENNETGNGADIAIIDTGIDDDHSDLQDNVGAGKAYVDCKGPNCNYAWSDDNDHGTHCAGIADAIDNTEGVVGVSTEATLHAIKVLDKRGSGTFSDVAAGIEYTADQGWDVGSMSLGASSGGRTLKDACQYAYDNGVLLVAAAGNEGPCTDCVGYPAAYSTVMAISSTDDDDTLSSFSSTGPKVELAAPGGSIYSTVIGGYDTFSGTSMACPHVSGAGGQLMANGYTNTEARYQLKSTAEDIGLSSNEQGSGLLDVEAAMAGSSDPSVVVSTGSATNVGETSATLNGSLDDLGGASSADCYFEYREAGTTTWTETPKQTLSSTGSFSETVDGLLDGVEYEFRAVADANDGDSDTGSIETFTTTEDSVAVSTGDATNVGDTIATLNGSLDNLGNASSAECYFEYRRTGASTWNTTSATTLSSLGSYSHDLSELSSGTDYEYRAVADASDGDSDTGSTQAFTTTGSSSSTDPTIDTHKITEAGSPNPHIEITVDWGVSDSDGDLSLVKITAEDADGSAFGETHEHSVSGASESGTDNFQFKHANGETADVTIYVEDATGNSVSHTEQVTE